LNDDPDLAPLLRGEKAAWDKFVRQSTALIFAAVRAVTGSAAEAEDVVQDVYLRLCKDDFRLLRTYDPSRAGLTTWLTIVGRSAAYDALRRKRHASIALDDAPEAALAVDPVQRDGYKLPRGVLSPRQELVLTMLYEREMDVADVAAGLGIDAQTVRSTHHKAMLKLRNILKVDS
jgi:RNA polymerase sigma-70 factor (ECF subfamily)